MRKLVATGIATVLCAGLAWTGARAGDGDGGDLHSLPPVKPSWWSGPAVKDETPDAKKQPPVEAAAPPRVPSRNPVSVQAREENAYWRRYDVCCELLTIAEKNGDDAMRERVYQLMDKAWAVYQQRTGASPARFADTAALTRPAPAALEPNGLAAAKDSAPWMKRGEQP
jgi:hypothetical protein